MGKPKKEVVFFKPSVNYKGEKQLNQSLISNNLDKGIQTSLILDTNILIKMEKTVESGNEESELVDRGLKPLVDLLKATPPKGICISPGFALQEIPPKWAESTRYYYEEFIKRHLPTYCDTPDSIRVSYDKNKVIGRYGFDDLTFERKYAYFINYLSIIYLISVNLDKRLQTPKEKFDKYINLISLNINCISPVMLEIAKYCFAPDDEAELIIKAKSAAIQNFTKLNDKRPKDINTLKAASFAATSDLALVQAANLMEEKGLARNPDKKDSDKIPQDVWIATCDNKFAKLFDLFKYLNDGTVVGRYVELIRTEDHNTDYWYYVDQVAMSTSILRQIYGSNLIDSSLEIDSTLIDMLVSEALETAQKVLKI